MNREHFLVLLDLVGPELEMKRDSVLNLNVITKLCIFLSFLRGNAPHRVCGTTNFAEVHESTVTRTVNHCAEILAKMSPRVLSI